MPIIFSEKQREEIKQKLKGSALNSFENKGVRKTTVAELAKTVGIAKGTFYNFYESKGALIADILADFDEISIRELCKYLEKQERIPIDKMFEIYQNAFRPESAFSFHFTPDDIEWLKETAETKHYFSPEYGIKTAKLILAYVDGIRSDVDYAYVVNIAKLINLMIENRESMCESAFDQNLHSLMELMLTYLRA